MPVISVLRSYLHGARAQRNDLLEQEPTTEPLTSCLVVPVLLTRKSETKGPTTRRRFRRAATVLPESFRTPTATLPRTSADVKIR